MAEATVTPTTDSNQDPRYLRALTIAATQKLAFTGQVWRVPSQSGIGTYRVASDGRSRSCTCPDYELRGLPCKHVLAVEIVVRREAEERPDGSSKVTEEVKVRVTYSQDWRAYDAAQCAEKDLFLPMLADICSTVPNPPQHRGRPRLPLGDMAFAAVAKVYSGLSARRFDSDVREAKARGLTSEDPCYSSVLGYLRKPELGPVLADLVTLSALPLRAVETDFAADSTGFSTCRFIRWYDHKYGRDQDVREWKKLHAMVGVQTNVITAAEVSDWNRHDSPFFQPLLTATAKNFTVREVSADKAYLSKANVQAIEDAGGTPYIPFKTSHGDGSPIPAVRGGQAPTLPGMAPAWARMYHLFAFERDAFLARYHQRSNVECTFSALKRKFGDSLRSKTDTAQGNEILCKVVAYNLCCVIAAVYELGLPIPAFGSPAA